MKKICLFVLSTCFLATSFWCANSAVAQNYSLTSVVSIQDQDDDQEDEDIQQRMRDAIMTYQEDKDEGIDKLRDIYSDNSDDSRIALTLIQILQQRAFELIEEEDRAAGNPPLFESADIARKLVENGEEIPDPGPALIASAVYNAACSHGVDGEKEKAMTVLKEAFELGFDDFDLVAEDSDFGDLLETDEFKKLIEDQRASAIEKEKAQFAKSFEEFESFEFDFETENMDGDDLALTDLRGKVVIVDFWGTWCPPCREEIPSYVKLKKELGDKIEIVGFAYERGDEEEAYENVVEFMEDFDINYECALGDEELQEMVPDFEGFPTTLFIDGEGTVKFMKVGAMDYERLSNIVNHLLESENK